MVLKWPVEAGADMGPRAAEGCQEEQVQLSHA